MRLLLDTHVLIWCWTGDRRLSERARNTLSDASNEVWISAASVWEMRTKARLGRLSGVPNVTSASFADLTRRSGFRLMDIKWQHAYLAAEFEMAHQDPFDRMLAAQASMEDLTLMTSDPALAHFGVTCLW
ncbi:MAG: type II toxin-antitoxin system VapC family toxin [Gammaproteobacteria bacterium]|nr:type II toxin-antitoxin system VapC family toxin [Gammaproteobacteria bacterium]